MSEWTILVVIKHFWKLKSIFMPIIAVICCLPLALNETKESQCAYVIVVMAILWLTEAIPIPATALMPIFLLPMLGVQNARKVCGSYVTDTSMLFLGGLILAVAVEEWNLHKRIALSILRIVGSQPNLLMLGLMVPTWFLSMWISNTAATAMMVPIIQAVVNQVKEVNDTDQDDDGEDNPTFEPDQRHEINGKVAEVEHIEIEDLGSREKVNIHVQVPNYLPNDDPHGRMYRIQPARHQTLTEARKQSVHLNRVAKGFSLSVAYAANMGGIATLTGTPPNLVLKGAVDELYKEYGGDGKNVITFANWMGFAFPLSLIGLLLAWAWLQLVFLRCSCCQKTDMRRRNAVKSAILKEYKDMGKMTFAEIEVLIVFCLLVILWLFRAPPNINGWGDLFTDEKNSQNVSDSTSAMLIGVLLFILPAEKPKLFCWADSVERPRYVPLLTWKAVEKKVAWGVIILLGGGFAIASASKESGLSDMVGNELRGLASQEPWVMNLILSLLVAGATELTSNTATATLLMPILSSLAISINMNPLYLMISGALACSFAFMLPVATPPNAIVFSCGYLSIPDMALAGLPMNFIAVMVLSVAINTWGYSMFSLDSMPALFEKKLSTLAPTTVNPCNFTVTPFATTSI